MRRFSRRFAVIAVAVCVLAGIASSGAFAAEKVLGFWFDTDTPAESGSRLLTLGTAPQSWLVSYTGSATVSPTASVATLAGGFQGKIWKYEYSVDGSQWNLLDTLVSDFSGTPSSQGTSKSENGGPVQLTAKYLKISYDVSLSSASLASASGSGSITATAVPEPSSLVVLATGLVPFVIRRRKA